MWDTCDRVFFAFLTTSGTSMTSLKAGMGVYPGKRSSISALE